jgi:glutathione S-transferase
MKVYGHPLSTCTRKVFVTLAEKGLSAELFEVDLFTGQHKMPAHLGRQPFGVIPVLEDDGFVLYESRAIIRYLDNRASSRPLTPRSPKAMARMDQWLSVDQAYVAPHVRALAVERIVKKHAGAAPDGAAVSTAEDALRNAFAILDRALEEGPFLAGESFSLADASLMPYVAALEAVGSPHLTEGLRRLGAWWSVVSERASWKAASSLKASGAAPS